jgi:polysaccharide deacetylase family sporulation protein PdaB
MKNKRIILAFAAFLVVAAVLAVRSGFELRMVPNKPHLKPRLTTPSPRETQEDFTLEGGSERDNRGFPQRKIQDLTGMFPDLFFREGPVKEKRVALTFDDGPDSVYTPQILDILKEKDIDATFFLIGSRAELFPDVVKRMVSEGHIVGNHTMTHPNILKLNKEQTKKNIRDAEKVLAKLTGYKPSLFRSPYGSLDSQKIKEIAALKYKVIAWNVDSLDWKSLTEEQVMYNILENVREGSIILQHSSGSEEEDLTGTVGALPRIIEVLEKEGYEFVTIPELLDIGYKQE